MPTKTPRRRARPARSGRDALHRPAALILSPADVRTILNEAAQRLAPADVTALLGRAADLRQRADALPGSLAALREQLALALDLLRDHVQGNSPQIPYYTISLLAAAAYYFSDEVDVIPDFLPHVGRLDDAAVMALACQLGADGLRRYCTSTGRQLPAILIEPRA